MATASPSPSDPDRADPDRIGNRKPQADVISDSGRDAPDERPTDHHQEVRNLDIQQAVERFVELHSGRPKGTDEAPDPMAFAEGYRQDLRSEILAQCREFLVFDGLLGHQEWQEPDAESATSGEDGRRDDGRRFGDFLILEELGRGGMGVVYLAKQKSLARRVALKVMASGLTLSKRHVERFRREAMATAQLRHPAIVPVHSLIEVDGTFALAMDYVAGRNLADILDDLRLANREGEGVAVGTLGIATDKGYVAECAMLVAQVASALAAAHHNQVVHRDLKPRNLMIDERRQVRLLDFGLAKSLDKSSESLSMSGEITGTAHYMSPEQTLAKRVEVDHRADIWSLGVILYELLTLRRPFDGKNLQQIVYEICFKEPTPLQRRNNKVPRDLVTICQKALEKDPSKRYQTAQEFEADLQRFLRWEPVHAKPASSWTRATKFLRRHRTEVAIAATLLVAATTVVAFVWARSTIDARAAGDLLQRAEAHASAGEYDRAITLTNQALELRNDDVTRERLGRYHAENKRIENEAYLKVAQSKQLLGHDRAGALRLALGAERQLANALTRSAVLDALGSGWAARSLPLPNGQRARVAAWSPSGQRVVVGGSGGTLRCFDRDVSAQSPGFEPVELAGHSPSMPIAGVAFLAEDRLISVSPDRTLRLWSMQPNAKPRAISMGAQSAAALRTSRDGSRALVVSYDPITELGQAQIWDTRSGMRIGKPLAHESLILAAQLSDDGNLAATYCGLGNTLRLWRTATGEIIETTSERGEHREHGSVKAVQFSPDSMLFATGNSDGCVCVYSAQTGRLLAETRHSTGVNCIAFDPDSARMLTGSRDLTAQLWQLDRIGTGDDLALKIRVGGVLTGHRVSVEHVEFDAAGELALTATGKSGGTIRVFDVGPGRTDHPAIHRYEVGAAIKSAQFAPNSRHVLAVAGRRALVLDFRSARGMVTLQQRGKVPAVSFTRDGRDVVTAGDDELLRRWHTRDGRQIWATVRLGNPILALDIAADDQQIACSDTGGVVHVLAMADGAEQFTLSGQGLGSNVPVVRFTKGGSRLLTAGSRQGKGKRGSVVVWDLEKRTAKLQLDTEHPVACADISNDGAWLVTVEADGQADQQVARLWSLPELKAHGTLGPHEAAIRAVHFAPDGTSVLTASDDGTARIHDLQGNLRTRFPVGDKLCLATFAPDGKTVLTCSNGPDGKARLWRVADATEILHFDGHRASLMWGTFSSSGDWAATSAKDGTTCIWPTDPVAVAVRLPHGDKPR